MFVIAKFFILKHVLSSEVYDFGIEFDDLQKKNLKLLSTVLYHQGLRSILNESVQLKTTNFHTDSDGGLTKLLYDAQLTRSSCFGLNLVELESQLETSLTKWLSKILIAVEDYKK